MHFKEIIMTYEDDFFTPFDQGEEEAPEEKEEKDEEEEEEIE